MEMGRSSLNFLTYCDVKLTPSSFLSFFFLDMKQSTCRIFASIIAK